MLITAECKMYRECMLNDEQVLAFANTRLDRPSGVVERLPDPATATGWLRAEFGWSGTLSATDHQAVIRLRDAVRGLLADRIAGRPPGRKDRSVLNDAAQPRVSELSTRWELIERPTEDQLCGRIAQSAMSVLSSDADLAECAAHDCVAYFARTDPRQQWHAIRCGNRVRAARRYARTKDA
jgi:predicted RNA-binding Zn ribbon-like protein